MPWGGGPYLHTHLTCLRRYKLELSVSEWVSKRVCISKTVKIDRITTRNQLMANKPTVSNSVVWCTRKTMKMVLQAFRVSWYRRESKPWNCLSENCPISSESIKSKEMAVNPKLFMQYSCNNPLIKAHSSLQSHVDCLFLNQFGCITSQMLSENAEKKKSELFSTWC